MAVRDPNRYAFEQHQDVNLGYTGTPHNLRPEQRAVPRTTGPNKSSIKVGRPPMPNPPSQSDPKLTPKQKKKALQDAMNQFWDHNA
jgi:hypothetical protein